MFNGCSSLTSLDLSNFNTSEVASMYSMFNNCNSLTTLNLHKFNTSNVTNMENMFYGCSNLTSLDLSSFNTSEVTNMISMFYDDSALTTIYVGSQWDISDLTPYDGNNMFTGCTQLKGENGTTYDEDNIGIEYAHIDVEGDPGYLSSKPGNGITTGLEKIENGELRIENSSEEWYTIDGRKINGKPTKKGVYIHDGRVVVR